MVARLSTFLFCALVGAPLMGQVSGEPDEPMVIDLTLRQAPQEPDPLAVKECEDEADVARIQGEIVVCRSLEGPPNSGWDARDFERRYAEATQGDFTPDVDGTGIQLPSEGSLIAVTVTITPGEAPEPPLFIDIEALPEAPPGSDADRRAQGLPARN